MSNNEKFCNHNEVFLWFTIIIYCSRTKTDDYNLTDELKEYYDNDENITTLQAPQDSGVYNTIT